MLTSSDFPLLTDPLALGTGGRVAFTPAFDGAPAAYSLTGYEQLLSSWTGPIIQARRSSDSAVLDVYALTSGPFKGQLDRAAIAAWAGTNIVRVVRRYDQSGNGRHVINTFAAQQPLLDISTPIAGVLAEYYPWNSIVGLGSNFQNVAYAGNFAAGKANLAIGIVSKTMLDTNNILLGGLTYGSSSYLKISVDTGGGVKLAVKRVDADTETAVTSAALGWDSPFVGILAEADFTNNVSRLTVDGVTTTGTTGGAGVSATGTTSLSLGGSSGTQNQGFNRALCMFDTALDAAGRAAISAALSAVANRGKITGIATWGDSQSAFGSNLTTAFGYYRIGVTTTMGGQTSTTVKNAMIADKKYRFFELVVNVGRNNYNAQATVLSDVADMIAYSKAADENKRVMSIANGGSNNGTQWPGGADYATILALNAALAAAYPGRYLDNRTYTIAAYNPANALDVIDFGHDTPPFTLRGELASGVLGGNINATDQAFTFTGGAATTAGTILLIGTEYIQVNFGTTGNVSGCVRAYAGSTAAAHTAGDAVRVFDPLHYGTLGFVVIANQIVASGL